MLPFFFASFERNRRMIISAASAPLHVLSDDSHILWHCFGRWCMVACISMWSLLLFQNSLVDLTFFPLTHPPQLFVSYFSLNCILHTRNIYFRTQTTFYFISFDGEPLTILKITIHIIRTQWNTVQISMFVCISYWFPLTWFGGILVRSLLSHMLSRVLPCLSFDFTSFLPPSTQKFPRIEMLIHFAFKIIVSRPIFPPNETCMELSK